ncbi:MAG: NAD-dependent epimerase/dehydratase family protein [Lachnospiraceae bacterium]|nr:NAD-dependent epimerase/dehydratase family protein [Lachnospiraceae bacterium]
MSEFRNHDLYREDLSYVASLPLPWEKLQGRSVMLSGATGMIGTFLIDVLLYKNHTSDLQCHIYALGRNREKAAKRFGAHMDDPAFSFVTCDITKPLELQETGQADYILHLASTTHPQAYASDPVGTVTANVFGAYNLLEYAVSCHAGRFIFVSSNEIYGENRGDTELFDESYCGYIDCNTLRAGYPEAKRCAEALCQAYIRQKDLDIVIPRLTRSFGPTLLDSDTKALSQFLHKALAGEDIVLKSEGTQYYSYTYTADAVAGLLYVMLLGRTGEAYNIADGACDIRLKDLAKLVADAAGRKVIFDLPAEAEAAGYSKATKARLDGSKCKALGWSLHYGLADGIERTLKIMR